MQIEATGSGRVGLTKQLRKFKFKSMRYKLKYSLPSHSKPPNSDFPKFRWTATHPNLLNNPSKPPESNARCPISKSENPSAKVNSAECISLEKSR